MTTHPLANNLLGKRNVLIVDACDELTKRIRRINRQLNKLDPSDDRAVRLNRTKDKLTVTFVELSRLHYEGKTFIPGAIVRYRKI